jgi:hypothetical protein
MHVPRLCTELRARIICLREATALPSSMHASQKDDKYVIRGKDVYVNVSTVPYDCLSVALPDRNDGQSVLSIEHKNRCLDSVAMCQFPFSSHLRVQKTC